MNRRHDTNRENRSRTTSFPLTLVAGLLTLIALASCAAAATLVVEPAQSADPASQIARVEGGFVRSAGGVGASAQAVGTATLGANLLANGDAEAGPVSSSGLDVVASIPGWTRHGNVDVVKYGASLGLFPAATDPGPASRGAALFCGGPLNKVDSLEQSVDLTPLAACVDSGAVDFELSGWLGGYKTVDDHVVVTVRFLDSSQALLAVTNIGPVLAADRADSTGLWLRRSTGALPRNARSAVVTVTFTGSPGIYVLGFADDLALVLSRVLAPSVAGVSWPDGGDGLRMTIAPNPAPTAAEIAFTLPADGHARVQVLDVTGRRVAMLADGAARAGAHSVHWSMRDGGGGAGVYFVRLSTATGTVVRRMVVLGR